MKLSVHHVDLVESNWNNVYDLGFWQCMVKVKPVDIVCVS